jgi:hypothetical protein
MQMFRPYEGMLRRLDEMHALKFGRCWSVPCGLVLATSAWRVRGPYNETATTKTRFGVRIKRGCNALSILQTIWTLGYFLLRISRLGGAH